MLPVLKWAGGKRQLLKEIRHYMPEAYNTYFEPFVGAGAVLFDIAPKHAYINDINTDLITVYRTLKDQDQFEKLVRLLKIHETNHNDDYYYEIRQMDREDSYKKLALYEKAARVIYLNKAGFNGLYRVNKKGYFNVPSGKKEKVKLVDLGNFNKIHNYLLNQDIQITNIDFVDAVKNAKKGDFVYFDPPYDPWEEKESFTAYAKDDFTRADQIRLFETFKSLADKGVYVMLSNHNTDFINSLYKDFNIHIVHANRMINSNPNGRGKVEEVIITNYE